VEREGEHRFGYVALVGRTNVGKSTLLNRLVDFPLAVITPKPQTTRHRIAGILTEPDYQIAFVDTPGLLQPRYALHEAMMRTTHKAIREADVILYVVEARDTPDSAEVLDEHTIRRIRAGCPGLLAINKVDLVRKDTLLPQISRYDRMGVFHEIVPVSALQGDGIDDLKTTLAGHLPPGPGLYPAEEVTDQPERFLAAEIVRGVVYEQYGEEIPYCTTVRILEFHEGTGGRKDHIVAEICVEKESQKGIIIGRRGLPLKKVGVTARGRLEALLGRSVYLDLRVRVRPRWRRRTRDLATLGY
jgi:GTP-binding protein Era